MRRNGNGLVTGYQYDNLGRRTGISRGNAPAHSTVAFANNGLNQVTQAGGATITSDARKHHCRRHAHLWLRRHEPADLWRRGDADV